MPGTGIENPGSGTSGTLPLRAKLSQNFPNPFNPVTTISYSIPQGNAKLDVSLKVYDLVGRLVAVLVDGEKSPGTYTAVWHGTNSSATPVASGIYIYKLVAGNYSESRRMILLK
jgi:flagellar hook assembly protein FlgD